MFVLFCIQFIAVVSAAVLPLSQSISQSQPASSSNLTIGLSSGNDSMLAAILGTIRGNDSNVLQSVSPSLSVGMKYTCHGGKWDSGLSKESCVSAYQSIPRTDARTESTEISWGPRDDGIGYDIGLPKRYLSTDGTCAIEPMIVPGHGDRAKASIFNVAMGAGIVISGCIIDKFIGGKIWEIGGDNGLAITVSRFRPEAKCIGTKSTSTILSSCESIADRMSTASTARTFGLSGTDGGGTDPDSILPSIANSRDGLCQMIVNTNDPKYSDWSNWYVFWNAAVAINAMCLRQGYPGGYWDDLGKFKNACIIPDCNVADLTFGEGVKGRLDIRLGDPSKIAQATNVNFGGSLNGNLTIA